MARPAKADAKPKESATVVVNIEDFVRTRDSVVTGLATLQSAVQDLSRAYIAHTNTVLGRAPGTSLDLLALANPLENGLLAQRPISPAAKVDEEPKKKRKRAPHDPNAPKRPLTPYFLYMHTARGKVAAELGPSAKPKDVADEGTRKWRTMPELEKQIWHKQYEINREAYRKEVKLYKAKKLGTTDLEGDAAQQLLAEQQEAGVIAGASEDEEEEEEEEEEEPTPEPPKAPTPPRASQAKRRKTAAESRVLSQAIVSSPTMSKREAEKLKTPEKRKKSKKEKEAEAEKLKKAEAAKAASEAALSKEKKGRKKRKSEAGASEA